MRSGRTDLTVVEEHPRVSLYEAYSREVRGDQMFRSLRTGVWVVVGLFTFSILLDYWVFPEQFWPLVGLGIGVDAALLLLW